MREKKRKRNTEGTCKQSNRNQQREREEHQKQGKIKWAKHEGSEREHDRVRKRWKGVRVGQRGTTSRDVICVCVATHYTLSVPLLVDALL